MKYALDKSSRKQEILVMVSEWVSEWISEWVNEWRMSEWVSEWVGTCEHDMVSKCMG